MFLRRLGKRGTAIVEYAIILAFAAAVGSSFTSDNGMTGSIKSIIGNVNQMLGVAAGKEDFNGRFKLDSADQQYAVFIDNVINGLYDKMKEREPNYQPKDFWIKANGDIYEFNVYDNNGKGGGARDFSEPINVKDLLPPDCEYTFSNFAESHIVFNEQGEVMGSNNNWQQASRLYISRQDGNDAVKNGTKSYDACLTFKPSTSTFGGDVDYWKK